MKIKKKEYRTTIIIGAGASRGAISSIKPGNIRLPLNRDYFDMLARFVKIEGGQANKNSFSRLISFINETLLTSQHYPTMEDVFNVLFMSKDIPEIFKKSRGRTRKPGYRIEIKDFISLLIKLFIYIQSNHYQKKSINHYEKLVARLSGKDTLITLNYDTLLDVELCNFGWTPELGYGFEARSKIKYDDIHRKPLADMNQVRLLKPHGSLNWFAKGKMSKLDDVLSRRPPSKIIMSRVPRTYNIKRERLIRFFIPPLYTKFFNNKFWKGLWRRCYLSLKDAECLIFLGCSLTATDYHLSAILSRVTKERKKKKFKKIIIVDKSKKTVKRIKRLLRGCSKGGYADHKTFAEFSKNL
ncbi:hypothetical protein ES705_01818 [subsurface metagenome]|nr:hypothetical protein [Clostridia bacterium]